MRTEAAALQLLPRCMAGFRGLQNLIGDRAVSTARKASLPHIHRLICSSEES